jgi:hypothetical protein
VLASLGALGFSPWAGRSLTLLGNNFNKLNNFNHDRAQIDIAIGRPAMSRVLGLQPVGSCHGSKKYLA